MFMFHHVHWWSWSYQCDFHGWFPTYFVKMTDVLRLCFIEANTLDSAVVSVPLIVTILRKYTKSDLFLNFFWILPSMVACFWMMRRGSGMPNQLWHCSKMTQKMQLKLHSIQHLCIRDWVRESSLQSKLETSHENDMTDHDWPWPSMNMIEHDHPLHHLKNFFTGSRVQWIWLLWVWQTV